MCFFLPPKNWSLILAIWVLCALIWFPVCLFIFGVTEFLGFVALNYFRQILKLFGLFPSNIFLFSLPTNFFYKWFDIIIYTSLMMHLLFFSLFFSPCVSFWIVNIAVPSCMLISSFFCSFLSAVNLIRCVFH